MRIFSRSSVRPFLTPLLLVAAWASSGCSGDAGGPGSGSAAGPGPGSDPNLAPSATGGVMPTDPGGPVAPPAVDVPAKPPLAGRLTKDQLANTIADVLGVTVDPAAMETIPRDVISESGFVTAVEGQTFTPNHVQGYSQLARSVAGSIDPTMLAQSLVQCADTTPACGAALSAELGRRLFRRPLLQEEQMRFSQLFTTIAGLEGATFEHAARGLLRGLLQAPQFLYKLEHETLGTPGTVRSTTGHELASRLSYYLWQSAPDDELLQFAANIDAAGGQVDPALLEQQVSRMMNNAAKLTRARATFWGDYTHASSAAFQDAEPAVAEELRTSVVAAFERVSGQGGAELPLQQIFTTTNMVMTPQVAQLAGLQPAGDQLQEYDTSGLPQRVGLLTHPGFLAAIGSTSFVGRGVILSQRVLCRAIIPPPRANFEEEINDTATATQSLTPKGASEYRFGLGGACAGCHKTFEPVAYAFERFDVLGDYREQDDEGRDLFTAGYLQGPAGENLGDYQGVADLMALLAASEETSRCFVDNMLEFASGYERAKADEPSVEQAHAEFVAAGATFSQLLRAVALNPSLRAVEVLPAE